VRYAFILEHQDRYAVQAMCRLLGLIRESHEASGRTYGAPRILCDLREVGECVGKNRIAKLM